MKATKMLETGERLFPEEAEACSSDGAARPPWADTPEDELESARRSAA